MSFKQVTNNKRKRNTHKRTPKKQKKQNKEPIIQCPKIQRQKEAPEHLIKMFVDNIGGPVGRRRPQLVGGRFNYSAIPCEAFAAHQSCPKNKKCPRAHGKWEVMYHPMQYKVSECRFFEDRVNYPNGCPRGSRCTYAHGKEDLRDLRYIFGLNWYQLREEVPLEEDPEPNLSDPVEAPPSYDPYEAAYNPNDNFSVRPRGPVNDMINPSYEVPYEPEYGDCWDEEEYPDICGQPYEQNRSAVVPAPPAIETPPPPIAPPASLRVHEAEGEGEGEPDEEEPSEGPPPAFSYSPERESVAIKPSKRSPADFSDWFLEKKIGGTKCREYLNRFVHCGLDDLKFIWTVLKSDREYLRRNILKKQIQMKPTLCSSFEKKLREHMANIRVWLSLVVELPEYASLFEERDIDSLEVFLDEEVSVESVLAEMSILSGHRIRIQFHLEMYLNDQN